MLKMLCAIRLRLFLGALTGGGKRRRGVGALYGFLLVYCVAVFGFLFGMLFRALRPLGEMGLEWLYFALAGILSTGLSFAGSVFMTQQQLYDAQDNQLLLSLPIPPMAVLGSRMLVLYLYDLLLGAMVLVPAAIACGGGGGLALRTLAAAVLLCGPVQALCPRLKAWLRGEREVGALGTAVLLGLLFLSITLVTAGNYQGFIYAQF